MVTSALLVFSLVFLEHIQEPRSSTVNILHFVVSKSHKIRFIIATEEFLCRAFLYRDDITLHEACRGTTDLLWVGLDFDVGRGSEDECSVKKQRVNHRQGGAESDGEESGWAADRMELATSQKHERLSLWILPLSQTCIRQTRPPCPRSK